MSECTICKKPIGDSTTSFRSPFAWKGKNGRRFIVHRDCVELLIQEKELVSDNSVRQIIRGLIKTFGDNPEYVTVIIGVLVGDKNEVKDTETEFSEKTSDLLSANGFVQLSNYREKKGIEPKED